MALEKKLTPEQLVFDLIKNTVGVPCSPVFAPQEGTAEDVRPSAVYSSIASGELSAFEKTLTTQTIAITARADTYKGVCELGNAIYAALQGSKRLRATTGFSDVYAEDLDHFQRVINAQILR